MPSLAPATSPTGRRARQRAIASVRDTLPSLVDAARRIESFYLAHPERHEDGAAWYRDARAAADAIESVSPHGADGPGVIAALSPQTPWSENVQLAFAAAEHAAAGPCESHGDTLARAAATGAACALAALGPAGTIGAVRACEAARGRPNGDTLGGRKVRAFRATISTGGRRPGPVVVDRHAVSLFYGAPVSERTAKVLERPGAYALVSAAYRTAARRLGISVAALQAAVWLAWRDVHSPGWAARDALYESLAANATAELPAGF